MKNRPAMAQRVGRGEGEMEGEDFVLQPSGMWEEIDEDSLAPSGKGGAWEEPQEVTVSKDLAASARSGLG